MAGNETIVAAALCCDGVVFSVPKPGRHGDIIRLIDGLGFDAGKISWPDNQGFLTSAGRFVPRDEARAIATSAAQLTARDSKLPELYSEDVW